MSLIRCRAAIVVTTPGLAGTGVLAPMTAPAQADSGELHAPMRPTSFCPTAHGGAEYESDSGAREFEIHLRGRHLASTGRLGGTPHDMD